MGGDKIKSPIDCGTPTADLFTVKLLLNSVVSTNGAKLFTLDIKNFYLNTPMERFEYMRLKMEVIPENMIEKYELKAKEEYCQVYVEIRKGMYGLPQAGILAQKMLEKRLKKKGYYQSMYKPGLWLYEWQPIQFSLVVDDFGVKYVGEANAKHLVNALVEHYEISQDWDGKKYCRLTLEWEHEAKKVHISMPGYVQDALQRFNHYPPQRRQDQPYPHTPPEICEGGRLLSPISKDG